jgi:DNA/RNA-binding domain of Phe-tRNA-synthetase-like protein
MEIVTDPLIIKAIGRFRLGIIASKICCHPSKKKLQSVIEKQVLAVQSGYRLDEVNKIEIIAETRRAYKKTGGDPNRYRPSADSLIRRIVKGMGIYHINNVVDVLNLVSVQSGYSIGGYDLQAIISSIELGIGREGEPYTGIGRGELNIMNLPVLRDKLGAFGTPTSDSQRTMIQETTKEIIFVFYDFGYNGALEGFLSKCSELLTAHCSAEKLSADILVF